MSTTKEIDVMCRTKMLRPQDDLILNPQQLENVSKNR